MRHRQWHEPQAKADGNSDSPHLWIVLAGKARTALPGSESTAQANKGSPGTWEISSLPPATAVRRSEGKTEAKQEE